MPDPIRVGVVGASPTRGWALGSHLPPLSALPDFRLVAVATSRAETARETAERFGVPLAFGDPGELVVHPDVDLVTVSVKVPHHYELVRAALEAGKHVFCEWPLGANTAEASELLASARAQGVRHVVGLQGRRSPTVNYVRDLVADGYLGELLYAGLAVEGEGRGDQIAEERVWTADRANGVGTLAILAGHNLDVLRYVVGDLVGLQATVAVRWPSATVVETGATIEVTSPDVVLLQGRTGERGYVSATVQTGLPKGAGAELELQGTDGVLRVRASRSLHLTDAALSLSGATGEAPPAPLVVPDKYRTVPEAVPDTAARNVAGLYLTLADAFARDEPPESLEPSFATALELHHLLDEIEAASESGRRRAID
ncbi:MAG TPA: Gfo/Idh/MocA family oxidoreductase [Acidimicrobiales bacterium]